MLLKKGKVNIWIFSGDQPGTYLSICRRKLACGLVSAVLALVAFVVFIPRSATEEPGLEPSLSGKEIVIDTSKLQGARALRRTLTEDFLRVRKYEQELKKRSELLEAILDEVRDLDHQFEKSTRVETPSDKANLGVGGGDEDLLPVISDTSSLRKRLSFDSTSDLIDLIDTQLKTVKSIPLGSPTQGRLSSGFGGRTSPFTRRYHVHKGVDIAVDWQSPVVSTADGIVLKAGTKGAYGQTIIIAHGNRVETLYGHLTKIFVKEGQRVCRGQRIGLVGSTGRSTAPHLHYEVRLAGVQKDPIPFIELSDVVRAVDNSLEPLALNKY